MIVIGFDKWKVKNRMRRPRFSPFAPIGDIALNSGHRLGRPNPIILASYLPRHSR